MFNQINTTNDETVSITFNDKSLIVPKGINVAAALLLSGVEQFRQTPTNAKPRGPFCMMGVCFDCLLTINGLSNQQSCMIEVKEGMKIDSQLGKVELTEQVNSND